MRDDQTGETYIAYAGTNFQADGYKDIRSDVAIGLNDPLYLKKNDLGINYEKMIALGSFFVLFYE